MEKNIKEQKEIHIKTQNPRKRCEGVVIPLGLEPRTHGLKGIKAKFLMRNKLMIYIDAKKISKTISKTNILTFN